MRTTASRHRGVTGRAVLTLALLVPALLLTLPSPARAAPTLQVTPTTVPADVPATIQAKGTECPDTDLRVYLFDPLSRVASDQFPVIAEVWVTPGPDGSWSAALPVTLEAGDYWLVARCADYEAVEVIAVPPTGPAVRPASTPVYLPDINLWQEVQVVGSGCTPTPGGTATVEGVARQGPTSADVTRTRFSTTARADGSWFAPMQLGPEMAPGAYTVEASCRTQTGGALVSLGTATLTITAGRYPAMLVTPTSASVGGPVRFSVSGDLCIVTSEFAHGGSPGPPRVDVTLRQADPQRNGLEPEAVATVTAPVSTISPELGQPDGTWGTAVEVSAGTSLTPGPYRVEASCLGAQQDFAYPPVEVELTEPAAPVAAPVQPTFTG